MMAPMTTDPQSSRLWVRASLTSATCMPVFYFGMQIVAAPFYPGYSFTHEVASMLGTSGSRHPWIFNGGAILTGVAAIGGSFGLYEAFRPGTRRLLSSLLCLSVAWTGVMSIKAGMIPLPDPRHGTRGMTLILLTPMLMWIGIGKQGYLPRLRAYLLLSVLLLVPIVLAQKGKLTIPGLGWGTLQRLFAFAAFVPIGIVGFFFLRREQRRPAQSPSRKLS
jgi:hypothetical membrane protein